MTEGEPASGVMAQPAVFATTHWSVVLAAGPEYKEIARNELDGSWTMSSIAVSGQQLFIRTGTHLYCIGTSAN